MKSIEESGYWIGNRPAFILSSRSCPYKCTFCFHTAGTKYRRASLKRIFEEIDYMIAKYDCNDFNFSDELSKIELVLTENLPSTPSKEWLKQTFSVLPSFVNNNHTDALIMPCKKLLELGGKRWRPLLMVLCAEAASKKTTPPDEVYKLTPLVEFVHTASLIHDDIEDNADTRRGAPAAHISYGLDTALNAASWLYFQASNCIKSSGLAPETQIQLYNLYATELRRLHLGQAMDITWHKNNTTIPTVAEYTSMVRLKTGTLASLAAQTGVIAGGGDQEQVQLMGQVAANIGVGFQVLDDVINLTTGNVGKKRGDDIVEGKKSLPILIHLTKNPEDFYTIMNYFEIAKQEGIESTVIEECIKLVSESGAIQEAQETAQTLISKSCSEVSEIYPDSIAANKITELFSRMMPK